MGGRPGEKRTRNAFSPPRRRAVVAHWEPGPKSLTLWSSTQIPHLLRTQLALSLKLPEIKVRVIAREVGGGFGAKLNVYRDPQTATLYLTSSLLNGNMLFKITPSLPPLTVVTCVSDEADDCRRELRFARRRCVRHGNRAGGCELAQLTERNHI